LKKTLWVLSAALLLLIAVLGTHAIRERLRDGADFVFDNDRIPEIVSLRVIYLRDTVDMVRKGPRWVMARDDSPVDTLRMANALRHLMGIRSDHKVSESGDEARLVEFGLNAAEAKRVEWKLASGEKQSVLLGKTSGTDYNSTYWKWEDKPGVYSTPGNFTYEIGSVAIEWKTPPDTLKPDEGGVMYPPSEP
jgi:hypothetical protein